MTDFAQKVLLVVVTALVGLVVTFFAGPRQDLQIIAYLVLAVTISFGIWAINTRRHRRERDEAEEEYRQHHDEEDKAWKDALMSRLDRGDEVDRAILRNELVKGHREWVESKGYITLESLEVLEKIHTAYSLVDGNDIGDKIWDDIRLLPIEEHREAPQTIGEMKYAASKVLR